MPRPLHLPLGAPLLHTRFVAFESVAALVAEDTNNQLDVYVRDRETGQLVCASTTATGQLGNDSSHHARISADGRWLVFDSQATNLVSRDVNPSTDVLRKDLQTGALQRVSNAWLSAFSGSATSTAAKVSDDGRHVAFQSFADELVPMDTNGVQDVFVRDMQTGQTQRVSEGVWGQANEASTHAAISGDGMHVAFTSFPSKEIRLELECWPSPRWPPTWCPVTRTAPWTCSCARSTPTRSSTARVRSPARAACRAWRPADTPASRARPS
jgi:Tol biopolymer transport system component